MCRDIACVVEIGAGSFDIDVGRIGRAGFVGCLLGSVLKEIAVVLNVVLFGLDVLLNREWLSNVSNAISTEKL